MSCYNELEISYKAAGETITWLASVTTQLTNVAVTQLDVESMRYDLYEQRGTSSVPVNLDGSAKSNTNPTAVPPANTVFDTWQHGDIWKEDSTGYNWLYQVVMPLSGKTYYAKITITLINGETVIVDRLFVTR